MYIQKKTPGTDAPEELLYIGKATTLTGGRLFGYKIFQNCY